MFEHICNCTNHKPLPRFDDVDNTPFSKHFRSFYGQAPINPRPFNRPPSPLNSNTCRHPAHATPEATFIDKFGTPISSDCGEIIFCKYSSSTLLQSQPNCGTPPRTNNMPAMNNSYRNCPQSNYFGQCCPHFCNNNTKSSLSIIDEETGSSDCCCAKKSKPKSNNKKFKKPCNGRSFDKGCSEIHETCKNPCSNKNVKKCNMQMFPVRRTKESYQCIMVKNKSLQCSLVKNVKSKATKKTKLVSRRRSPLACSSEPVKITCKKNLKNRICQTDTTKYTSVSITCLPRDLIQDISTKCSKSIIIKPCMDECNKTQAKSKFWLFPAFRRKSNSKTENNNPELIMMNPCFKDKGGRKMCGIKKSYTVLTEPLPQCPTPSEESLFNKYKRIMKRISLTMTLR